MNNCNNHAMHPDPEPSGGKKGPRPGHEEVVRMPSEEGEMITEVRARRAPRVSLTGAPCVGKTTLARALAEHLHLPLLPERSREVARDWGYTPASVPEELRLPFQWAILERQIEAEDQHADTGYISDRCPIDSLCHFEYFGPLHGWPAAEEARYRRSVEARLAGYDLLIVIPPMFPIVDDGERIADPTFQSDFQRILETLVASWRESLGPRLHVVSHTALTVRVEAVLQALGAVPI